MAKEIKLDGVTKEFGSIVAVEDVSLTIPEGEFVTLVGPSGSGKTTLLRMIAGLESPTSGTISFGGKDLTTAPPQDRPLSMVFQNIALYPHMTCRENIGYGLKIHGVPVEERNERIEEAAQSLQIEDQLDKSPSELSGGQQQRVAIGRAFVEDPEVLLLDEPMSDLDAKLKETLRVEFQRLHHELDATFVYVTHDQNEAMTMSDKIAVMNEGRVAQFDSPESIFHDPVSRHVSTFIGTPSTNVLAVDVNDGVGRVESTTLPLPNSTSSEDQVLLGVRPQYLTVGGGDLEFDVTVDVIEPLGIDYVVHTTSLDGDNQVNVVTDSVDELAVGDVITIGAALENVHLFRSSGERIRRPKPDGVEAE
ncbi:ABC transporter ATP-binding protein [Halococcus sp. IIIV-5B]|uniref:ABC transporter ATP-binding protein n=1 Tax=Halococcus sp. IIIV-5B TaxID=2321230 RepID=UPI000E760247|nr:ABC transporter ATP-binding protein [Halococcus sp. IIIV-5B]RJT07975.1 ABC transporter ATP-binding protein [Halococcus sp. IIIV-5B]